MRDSSPNCPHASARRAEGQTAKRPRLGRFLNRATRSGLAQNRARFADGGPVERSGTGLFGGVFCCGGCKISSHPTTIS